MQKNSVFKILALGCSLSLVSLFIAYRAGYFSPPAKTPAAAATAIPSDNSKPVDSGPVAHPDQPMTTLPSSKSIVPLFDDNKPSLGKELTDSLSKIRQAQSATRLSSSKSGIIADSNLLKAIQTHQK